MNQMESDVFQGNLWESHMPNLRTMLTLIRIPSGSLKRVSKCLPPTQPRNPTNHPHPESLLASAHNSSNQDPGQEVVAVPASTSARVAMRE